MLSSVILRILRLFIIVSYSSKTCGYFVFLSITVSLFELVWYSIAFKASFEPERSTSKSDKILQWNFIRFCCLLVWLKLWIFLGKLKLMIIFQIPIPKFVLLECLKFFNITFFVSFVVTSYVASEYTWTESKVT